MADKRIDQLVAATTMGDDDLLVLEQNNQAKKLSGRTLGNYVYAAAAEKVSEVEAIVTEAQEAVDSLEEQKNEIAEAIASMADFGTDTSLSTPGMAADAKATGDKIKDVSIIARAGLEQESATPGSIVTITDAAEDVPVKSMMIGIEPVQDLHGQSNPYPAGGGKNQANLNGNLPYNDNGITITKNDDGSITVNGTATSNVTCVLMQQRAAENGAWTISGVPVNSAAGGFSIWARNQLNGDNYARTYNGVAGTVNISTGTIYIYCTISSGTTVNNVKAFIQLEQGSIATAYAPYENICPITGWTGANVTRTGKNMLNPNGNLKKWYFSNNIFQPMVDDNTTLVYTVAEDGTFTVTTTTGYRGLCFFVSPVPYKRVLHQTPVAASRLVMFERYESGASSVPNVNSENDLIIPENTSGFVGIRFNNAGTYSFKLQFEMGSTPTDYEQYKGTTIPITFPNEAGTVYGGTLTNNRADEWKLTVEYDVIENPTITFRDDDNYRVARWAFSGSIAKVAGAGISNKFKYAATAGERVNYTYATASSGVCWVLFPNTMSDADIATEMSTAQFVRKLATPITYTLTAAEVKTLLGLNNIWADTGDIEELTYYKPASAGKITSEVLNTVEPMIAGVEEELVATQNYAIGDLFIANHAFYKATAAITTGETIAPGSNCEATNVADELKNSVEELQESLDNKADIDGYYKELSVGLADNLASTVGIEDKVPYNFRTSGGAIDIGEFETDTIVGGTIAWNQLVTTDTNVSKTKSGPVVSVTDAVAENAQGLVVGIEPVQDLHGYDYPWPGGTGKNLFNKSLLSQSSAYITYYSSYVYTDPIQLKPNTDYVVSPTSTDSLNTTYYFVLFRNADESDPDALEPVSADFRYLVSGASGKAQIVTFTTGATGIIRFAVPANGTSPREDAIESFMAIDYQLEEGSVATEWIPYSNICPITGWTGANVVRTGTNLLEPKFYDNISYNISVGGKVVNGVPRDATNTVTKNGNTYTKTGGAWQMGMSMILPIEKSLIGKTVVFSGTVTGDSIGWRSAWYITDKSYTLKRRSGSMNEQPRWVITLEDGDAYLIWFLNNANSGTITVTEPKIEFGSTASTYEAPNITTIPINFPNEAGTVYSGTLNATTGALTVTHVKKIYDGTQNPSIFPWGSTDTYVAVLYPAFSSADQHFGYGTATSPTDCYCNAFKPKAYGNNPKVAGDWMFYSAVNAYGPAFYFPTNTFGGDNTQSALNAYLANNPIELVYPLETPRNYTLTPQQVQMLLGANNVWSDTGDTSLTYLGTTNEITAQANHKYLTKVNGTSTIVNGSSQVLSGEKGRDNIFDLTRMFGSDIANYVYILEQTTTGTGISWFNHLFPKPYYSYNAGELMSVNTSAHKMVGFNQFDGETEEGFWNTDTGEKAVWANHVRTKNYIPIFPSTTYYKKCDSPGFSWHCYYDADKNFIGKASSNPNTTFITPQNAYYMTTYSESGYGNVYKNDLCINLSWDGERDGEYEAYQEYLYPLDESLTLRGVPKLASDNSLYYDGDIYESDGKVTRKYGVVVYDGSNDETWTAYGTGCRFKVTLSNFTSGDASKPANLFNDRGYAVVAKSLVPSSASGQNYLSGTDNGSHELLINIGKSTVEEVRAYLAANPLTVIYERTTPTTESANPYTNPQFVDDFGTEEYVDYAVSQGLREVSVPVGHDTIYNSNLRAKLEMAPNSPDENGDYIVRKTNEGASYVPLTEVKELPDMPSIAGTYNLQLTIANGVPTLTWVML